jgi:hypothetical protein
MLALGDDAESGPKYRRELCPCSEIDVGVEGDLLTFSGSAPGIQVIGRRKLGAGLLTGVGEKIGERDELFVRCGIESS